MSASKNKKKRQQERLQGTDKRVTRDEAARKAKKLNRMIAIISTSVIAVFVAIVITFSSSGFYRSSTAVRVEDTKYSVADFNFYFYTEYFKHYATTYNQYGDYAAYLLPSRSQSFASQMYSDDQTWAEYFENKALEYLEELTVLYNEAKANGYKISEEAQKAIEEELEYGRETAKTQGISLNKYYSSMYGKGVNEAVFARNMEKVEYVSDYVKNVYDSYEYSTEDLKVHYDENKDDLDWYKYRYFYLAVSGQSGKEKDEAADKKAALEKAEKFVAAVKNEKDFAAQALANVAESSKEYYKDEDYTLTRLQGVSLNEDCKEWLADESRKEGDVTYILTEDEKGYYILYFIERDNNEYNTIDVRHLLIEVEEPDKDDYDSDSEYEAAVDAADEKALKEIEKLYEEWKEGKATEESFADLADKHSDDNSDGGLYEDVYRGRMVEEFDEWCFDESRKPGDVEIIRTEYGYHLMYFVAEGGLYSDYLADTSLRNEQQTEWIDGLLKDVKSKTTWTFSFVG